MRGTVDLSLLLIIYVSLGNLDLGIWLFIFILILNFNLYLFILAVLHGLWDLSSLTRNQTLAPWQWNVQS